MESFYIDSKATTCLSCLSSFASPCPLEVLTQHREQVHHFETAQPKTRDCSEERIRALTRRVHDLEESQIKLLTILPASFRALFTTRRLDQANAQTYDFLLQDRKKILALSRAYLKVQTKSKTKFRVRNSHQLLRRLRSSCKLFPTFLYRPDKEEYEPRDADFPIKMIRHQPTQVLPSPTSNSSSLPYNQTLLDQANIRQSVNYLPVPPPLKPPPSPVASNLPPYRKLLHHSPKKAAAANTPFIVSSAVSNTPLIVSAAADNPQPERLYTPAEAALMVCAQLAQKNCR